MKNKGFTLIELLVAMAVFSLVIMAMSATAVAVIKSQRKAFALQNTQEASRYILESVSKEIRMSTINSADSGGSPIADLDITNAQDENVVYQFSNNKIYRQGELLNPSDIEVSGGFYVRKGAFPSQAAVTIVMKIRSTGTGVEEQTEIYLQSTISSRAF